MSLPILTDSSLQSAVEILGPSGTVVSLATTFLLTIRFVAFVLQVIMWFFQRKDAIRDGKPSLPPPELPPSLGIVLMFAAGSTLAMMEPAMKIATAQANIPVFFLNELYEPESAAVGPIEGKACDPACDTRTQRCENGICVSRAKRPMTKTKPKSMALDSARDIPGWEDQASIDPFPTVKPENYISR